MNSVAAILTVVALVQTLAFVLTAGSPTPDGTGSIVAAYRSVKPLLPATGVVGFIDGSTDPDFNIANHYLAQHALAPLIISREARSPEFVLTTTDASPEIRNTPALSGFRLIGTGAKHVLVFRREQP